MKKIKFLIITISLFCCFLNLTSICQSEKIIVVNAKENIQFLDNDSENENNYSLEDAIEILLKGLDFSSLDDLFNKYIPSNSGFKDFFNNLINGNNIDYKTIFNGILNIFKENLFKYVAMIGCVLSIIVSNGIISNFNSDKNSTNGVVYLVCYCSIALLLFMQTSEIFKSTFKVIRNLNIQSQSVFPILLTLLSITGGNLSGDAFKPVCLFLSNGIMSVTEKVLIPLLSAILIISAVCTLSEKFSLNGLSKLLSDVFKWIIGGITGIFTLFTTFKGITSATFDGVSIKLLKNSVSSGIPIIGGFAKDGIDVFLAGGLLIKNTFGVIFLIIIFSAFIVPLLNLLIFSLSLKLLSAIAEPVADNKITALINSFSKATGLCIALLILVFLMYFVTIILVISSQSFAIM